MMSRILCLTIYVTIDLIIGKEAARILGVFPVPSISHQIVFRPLMQELAKRGHEVIVITTHPAFPKGKTPINLQEIDLHDISYESWNQESSTTTTRKKHDVFLQMKISMETLSSLFEKQMKSDEVQKIIHDSSKQFDLLVLESVSIWTLGFSHVFKVPVIRISSFGAVYGDYERIGAPTHPILYPSVLRQRLYNLTMREKISELYNEYRFRNLFYTLEEKGTEILKRVFGADTPPLKQLNKNVHMLFLNIHPIWEGNRPVPPNVIHIGGLHIDPEKKLPKDLKSYLDSSKNGVIYISFGTSVDSSMLPPEKIHILVKVLSQLPYDVLWKWDEDELPERTQNIRISKWMPQSDLLRHSNVKVFITQGGLQSTHESITAGVPLIGMPILADQWYNVEKYLHHKIGLKLDMETLTEEEFKNAIVTIINDKSYRENVVRLRALMYDQPQRPLDRAVWWTEHVLRHGGARHLRAPAANISWSEFLELELVFILLTSLLTVIIICGVILYFAVKIFTRKLLATNKLKST